MFLTGIQLNFNKINGWIQDFLPPDPPKPQKILSILNKLAKYVPDIKKFLIITGLGGGNGWHGQICLSVYPVWLGDHAIS